MFLRKEKQSSGKCRRGVPRTSRTNPSSCRAPRGLSQPAMNTHTCTHRHMHTQARPHASLQDTLLHMNDSEPRGTSSVPHCVLPTDGQNATFRGQGIPRTCPLDSGGRWTCREVVQIGENVLQSSSPHLWFLAPYGLLAPEAGERRLRLGRTHTSKASPGGIWRASGGPRAGDPFGEARGVSVDARRGPHGSGPQGAGCPPSTHLLHVGRRWAPRSCPSHPWCWLP